MSYPLINRITVKKDGVYFSHKENNDSMPYYSSKINGATNAYENGGRKGLDEYMLKYIGVGQEDGFIGQLRGNHPSIERLKAVQHMDDLDAAMNQLQFNDLKPVIEDLGWKIYDAGDYVELGQYSPAGEDFNFPVNKDNIVQHINFYAYNFDVDEHIEMWVEARSNGVSGVPSTRELVEDAKDIKEMLKTLADKLNEVDAKYREKPAKSLDSIINAAKNKASENKTEPTVDKNKTR